MHTRGAQWNGVGARGRGAGRVGAALGAANGGNGKIAATRTLAHTFSRHCEMVSSLQSRRVSGLDRVPLLLSIVLARYALVRRCAWSRLRPLNASR